MGTLSTSTTRMRVLVIFCALVSIAIAGGRVGKGKGGKNGKGGKGKGDNGGKDEESMATMMGGKDEMMQEMMEEKEGLCLSNDQVHMMCGIGTKLQEKMDAALKQCVPVPPEMMAATMEDMQDPSMTSAVKLLSSGRAFDFDDPAERRGKTKSKSNLKNSKKKSKKDKKPFKKNKKLSKKNKKPSKMIKKPSKKPSPSVFKSCEASCPSLDEMRASAMEEMKTELCVLNAIGWM